MSPTRPRRGANSVEFAMLLPVYLMLAFGITDWGWMMYHLAALHAAAHQGCREASLLDPGKDEAGMQDVLDAAEERIVAVFEDAGPGCPGTGCDASAVVVGVHPSRSLSCRVQVRVEPLMGLHVGSVDLAASAVIRLEHQRSD